MTQSHEPTRMDQAHELFEHMAGEWQGVTRTWFEPGVLADESPWRGRIRLVLGGGFALHEYQGAVSGEAFQGLALYGFNPDSQRWEMAWADTNHTRSSIMFAHGEMQPAFSVLGFYGDPSGGPDWGWRTQIEMPGPDELIITAYNIPPNGPEAKAVETHYHRAALSDG